MNYTFLIAMVVVLVLLFALWAYSAEKETQRLYSALDDFLHRAEELSDVDALCALNLELVAFAKAKCWHRAYSSRAHQINEYIIGKVQGIRIASRNK